MKKRIIVIIVTIIVIAILLFIVPVKKDVEYKYGQGDFDISNPMTYDYTIYNYKNLYGITIHTSHEFGITIIN